MARYFTAASIEYLRTSAGTISGFPFSFAGWFYPTTAAVNSTILSVGDKDDDDSHCTLRLDMNLGTPRVAATINDYGAGTARAAHSTTQCPAGSWYHGCAVFVSTTSRSAYLNGSGKGSDANVCVAPFNHDCFTIGAPAGSKPEWAPFDGALAWLAAWNVALIDDEAAQLALGICPLLIRPQSLVGYWPLGGLHGANDNDIVGGFHMTAYNTPTWAEHPGGLWYPRGVSVAVPTAGAGIVTGTIAQTLPALTQAAAGQVIVAGTAAQTLPALTQAAAGQIIVAGDAAQTLPALSQAAAGQIIVIGDAAQTLPALTQSATGQIIVIGDAAQTLPALTQAAAGQIIVAGDAAQTLPALTQAAAGQIIVAGDAAQTLPALTQAAAGQLTTPVDEVWLASLRLVIPRLAAARIDGPALVDCSLDAPQLATLVMDLAS